MLNSDTFLGTFSAIESWLRKQVKVDRSTPFPQVVERAAIKNSAVRRYANELKEFADLRNAIVHERTDGHVIAEPNDRALAEFERIRIALLTPPFVIPKFQRTVRTRTFSDSVGDAVTDMRSGSFSQLPILSGTKVCALLTAETVVRWLASEVENELVSPWETKIEQILSHTEDPKNHYCFLARSATLHDALSLFEDFAARGKDLDAILISHDGSAEQQLLGILTLYDLPAILEELGLKRVSTV